MATGNRNRPIMARGMALALALMPVGAAADTPRGAGSAVWEDQAVHGIAVDHGSNAEATEALEQEIAALGEGETLATAQPGPFDAVLRAVGRLPEPATWGLMIVGFGAIGGAMRRRMRKSDADFTARIRRIADGEDGQA